MCLHVACSAVSALNKSPKYKFVFGFFFFFFYLLLLHLKSWCNVARCSNWTFELFFFFWTSNWIFALPLMPQPLFSHHWRTIVLEFHDATELNFFFFFFPPQKLNASCIKLRFISCCYNKAKVTLLITHKHWPCLFRVVTLHPLNCITATYCLFFAVRHPIKKCICKWGEGVGSPPFSILIPLHSWLLGNCITVKSDTWTIFDMLTLYGHNYQNISRYTL